MNAPSLVCEIRNIMKTFDEDCFYDDKQNIEHMISKLAVLKWRVGELDKALSEALSECSSEEPFPENWDNSHF